MSFFYRLLLPALLAGQAALLSAQTADTTQLALIGTTESPVVIADGDSVKYYAGQVISISGVIAGANKWEGKDGTICFLNMFRDYPNNPFSITIYRQNLAFFEPIEQFKGKKVRVTGKVNAYKDKKTNADRYSIVLKKPEQIEILDK